MTCFSYDGVNIPVKSENRNSLNGNVEGLLLTDDLAEGRRCRRQPAVCEIPPGQHLRKRTQRVHIIHPKPADETPSRKHRFVSRFLHKLLP